jgi:hypothetical protein
MIDIIIEIRVKISNQKKYESYFNQIRDFKEIQDLFLIELTHTRRNTSKTYLTKKYETSPNQIRVTIIKYV